MSNDPWSGGEITATIKAGKGYDEPWLVFRGPNAAAVRTQIEESTGLSGEGISLAALVYNANDHFSRINTVAHGLDAIVVPDDDSAAAQNPAAAPEPTEAENVAPAEAPASAEPSLADQVNALTVKKELIALYQANKKAFDGDKKLMDVLQKRFTSKDVS